jgi:hypothetical protein
VNDERLLAAIVVATAAAGGALLMRPKPALPERWMEIHWPRDVDDDSAVQFMRTLAGDRSPAVVVFEVVAQNGKISYRVGLPARQVESLPAQLRSFIPGATLTLIDHSTVPAPNVAWELGLTTRHRPLRVDDADSIARALIAAMATSHEGETLVMQWVLGPRLIPARVASKGLRPTENARDVVRLLHVGATELDTEERRALANKVGDAGFRVIGRFGVAGAHERRAQALASRMMSALRSAEAPGVQITSKRTDPSALAHAAPAKQWPLALNVREMVALSAWPLGNASYEGVRGHGPTPLPYRGSTTTRCFASSTYPGHKVDIGLSIKDALQHLHVLGPTGVGKSTLMLNLILRDIEDGRGVVVIDPKGDLVDDVLARIPSARRDDVVVLDPADDEQPIGLNVLQARGRPSELIADQVLAVFHGLYRDSWGPRTQDILHASLLTLAGRPGMTLCALPVLLSNERFRSQVIGGLTDEIALKPFWHWFNTISEGERAAAIAPVMNKLRAFLLRPRMRSVLGQATPRFEIDEVFTGRKILLVSLAKGLLGPEAAALLGSLIVSQLWQATLGRVRIPSNRRSAVSVYVDEFQDYLHLPTDLSDVLAQARGLGLGMTLAHQHLGQLTPVIRSAVMANARSRVCFQLSADDARTIAGATKELTPEDLQGLPRFEAYASLMHDSTATPYASIRTWAPPAACSDPATIREQSRSAYGTPVAEIEKDLARLIGSDSGSEDGPIGRRRRT